MTNALERRALEAHAHYEKDVEALYDPRTGLPRYPESELEGHKERLRSLRDSELLAIERSAREERALQEEAIEKAQRVPPHSLLTAEELQAATAAKAYVEDDVSTLDPKDLQKRLQVVMETGDKATKFAYAAALRSRIRQMRQAEGRGLVPMVLTGALESLTESLLPTRQREKIEFSRDVLDMADEAKRAAYSLRIGDKPELGAAYMNRKYRDSMKHVPRSSNAPGPVPAALQGAPRASGPPPGRSGR